MKRTATAVFIAGSLSFLVACGGEEPSPKSANNTPNSSDTSPTSTDDAKPAANPFAKAKGKVVYNKTCLACHGEGGLGVENLGKDMTISEFIKSTTDQELIDFIKIGRMIDDPMSDGIAPMPPMGGDPTLSDTDLENVVLYIRSLQK